MLPYHITITLNETGETYLDMDACAIIGASGDEEKATVISSFDCDFLELLGTVLTSFRALEKTLEQLDPLDRSVIESYLKKGGRK